MHLVGDAHKPQIAGDIEIWVAAIQTHRVGVVVSPAVSITVMVLEAEIGIVHPEALQGLICHRAALLQQRLEALVGNHEAKSVALVEEVEDPLEKVARQVYHLGLVRQLT